jgi:hypothetical protein
VGRHDVDLAVVLLRGSVLVLLDQRAVSDVHATWTRGGVMVTITVTNMVMVM